MEVKVVVGVDGSARSRAAADWAAREALSRRLPLRVAHVSSSSGRGLVDSWPYRPETVADSVVRELAARHPALKVEGVWLTGAPVPALAACAAGAAVTVLGSRGAGGFAGLALGTVAQGVAASVQGPVVLVPSGLVCEGPRRRPDKVTLGLDARHPADDAVDFALDVAARRGARLHALYAWELPLPAAELLPLPVPEADRADWEDHEVQLLSDALRPWRDKYPQVRILEDVALFDPAKALARASGSAQMMVVGRGRGDGLGPVVDALVRQAKCPVAVVPS
ncbi:universal stress protein [Streptomyces formicae]|uniref:Universal stress protein family n=1 Tax=Streptomyces formicae TaxID=1616117 RepID=A0A291QL92_9ACTN|nr:universal stress protein [Streptomyces formicae]ATL32215.1 Universal stress protein family [Streptomyces formicae]